MTIYLDHAATSPMREPVLAAYTEALKVVGNPNSIHSAGQSARAMIEGARERIARIAGCDRNEVVFTSGGTEANNLAIKGLFSQRAGNLIVSAPTEHHAVLDSIEYLEKGGAEVYWLKVDNQGVVDLAELEQLLADRAKDIALVALMSVNNETGVITPIEEVARLANAHEVPVHTDAVAAFGHMPLDFAKSGVATMAITAHKLGGPVGVGALLVSRATKLTPQLHGGEQERGMRAGTMDAAGALAFAVAAETPQPNYEPLANLAIELIEPLGRLTRQTAPGVANILNFVFTGADGESMLFLLDQQDIAASNGAACTAGVIRNSHVLLGMGFSEADSGSALRVSFGPQTTENDIRALAEALPSVVAAARKI